VAGLTVWQCGLHSGAGASLVSPPTLSYEGGGYGLAHLGFHK